MNGRSLPALCRGSEEAGYVARMNRERGTVKWFSREKGWGFLKRENGDEIFVHHSDIEGEGHVSLVDDEEVEFGVEDMEKGPRARQVRRPGQAPAASSERSTAARSTGSSDSPDRRTERVERGERAESRGPSRGRDSADEPEKAAAAGATRSDGTSGGPPPLDRGLRQRLADRFPIFRDR